MLSGLMCKSVDGWMGVSVCVCVCVEQRMNCWVG
jgi:hypothetical protein